MPRALVTLASMLTLAASCLAQEIPAPIERQAEISSVKFDGNETFSNSELRAQIQTRETPGFFSKFLHRTISEKLGRKDEFLNPFTLGADLKKLRTLYQQYGFMSVQMDTGLAFAEDGSTVDITFKIHEGYRSVIDSLVYKGIPAAPEAILQDVQSSPKIAKGDPFVADLLEAEVRRVLETLNNNGFPNAAFVRDSSSASRYASSGNFIVILTFNAGKRFVFGNVTVEQDIDTARGMEPRDDISNDIILRHLDFKPGDFFSLEERTNSEKDLNRLGIFDIIRMDARIPPKNDSAVAVPIDILIRPKDKHELAPELIASNENDAFNLGAGIGYNQRNFFGGARIFGTHVRFRTQTIKAFPDYFALNSDAVSNFDVTFDLLQPFIFTNKVKGTWSFSYIVDKEIPYKLNIVRNRLGVNDRFAEFTTGMLDWTLESVNLYLRDIDTQTLDPESQQQLRLLPKRQVNSVLSFTMQRDMTNDIFSPSEGFIHSMTVQEAGSLPRALRLVDSLYTEFYSVSLMGRWYHDVGLTKRTSILAVKLKAAMEEKYGRSESNDARTIPPTYRFYAGGSGSVRGWNSRDLIASGEADLGGNLSIEGSVEWRLNPLQTLHDGILDKIWIVQFLDFGNLWPTVRSFQVRDVAIAAGLGIRYDTFFGPFRIDWGFRVYNPGEPPGQQWITQRKLMGQTFKEGIFHFGIGQAF